jgi:hypothetical protein
VSDPGGNAVIFDNLGVPSTDRYFNNGEAISGTMVLSQSENWWAVPFTPRADSHVKTLAAGIGYLSGTSKVNLGVYSDSEGTVGTLLPGAEESTTEIPVDGECCDLAQVTLPGDGIALSGHTQYWLVASTDDVDAPNFFGVWHNSTLAVSSSLEPRIGGAWATVPGGWFTAKITGTVP